MIDYYPPLVPNTYYHIFNRGNNRENLFYKPANASFFLEKYAGYLSALLDTYAYCLLPNHFHLLIRVKMPEEIVAGRADIQGLQDLENFVQRADPDPAAADTLVGEWISRQFRLFFMSYAKAVNKQEGRTGSLFQKNFKRLQVASDEHLLQLVLYIHANPQLHGLHGDFRDWNDSSYAAMLSNRPSKLRRDEVLTWFGGREQLVQRHQEYIDWKTAGQWLIED